MSTKYSIKANRHRRRTLRLQILFAVSLVSLALVLGGAQLYKQPVASKSAVNTNAKRAQTSNAAPVVNHGLPVRLQIPKLGVDSKILNLGITSTGNMAVPTSIHDTGWYKYGALPGNNGTAVIAGHLDGLRNEPGVFDGLRKLVPGDTVSVTDTNGLITQFVVRTSRSYDQNAQPEEVFNSTTGSHLNLITCTGSWDSAQQRFAQRLVVFTDKQAP